MGLGRSFRRMVLCLQLCGAAESFGMRVSAHFLRVLYSPDFLLSIGVALRDAPHSLAPPPPPSAQALSQTSATLERNLRAVRAMLPPRTAAVMLSGHSDTRRMSALDTRKSAFENAIRSEKPSTELGLEGGVPRSGAQRGCREGEERVVFRCCEVVIAFYHDPLFSL